MPKNLSRRTFFQVAGLATLAVATPILAACGTSAQPTQAPTKPADTPKPAAPTKAPEAPKPAAATPTTAPVAATSPTGASPTPIVWWHHWAAEDSKKQVINQFIEDYQKEHSNVKINIRWWEKAEMYPVARNSMTAGKDFPDIMYGPEDPFVEAGWVEDLTNVLDWSQFQEGAKERTTRTIAGKTGVWDGPLESGSEEIYYNPQIFDAAGIKVPEDKQFTADEFYEVCQKLRDAGFDPFAQGIGDRDYPGRYLSFYALSSMLGPEVRELIGGKLEWTKPEVKEALEWVAKLAKIPVMPPTFATMNLAESHQYFHTPAPGKDLPRAAMFLVGAWYTGRAFVPPEKGGQPADFRVSFLQYPSFTNGKGTGLKIGGGGGGAGAVISLSANKDVAKDIQRTFMNVKYGSLWLGLTYVPTELKSDPKLIPPGGQYAWYAEEYARAHQAQRYVTLNLTTPAPLAQAIKAALNEGLPQNLVTVDQSIDLLEKGRTAT